MSEQIKYLPDDIRGRQGWTGLVANAHQHAECMLLEPACGLLHGTRCPTSKLSGKIYPGPGAVIFCDCNLLDVGQM